MTSTFFDGGLGLINARGLSIAGLWGEKGKEKEKISRLALSATRNGIVGRGGWRSLGAR
jgi:hypothetical protein